MRCPSCGFENAKRARECAQCEESLLPDVSVPAQRARAVQEPSPKRSIRERNFPLRRRILSRPRKAVQPSGEIEGRVVGFTERKEAAWTVWSFRVESVDDEGNVRHRVPVEMRAIGFEGNIANGDTVEADGEWGATGASFKPAYLYNRSTRTPVVESDRSRFVRGAQRKVAGAMLIVWLLGLLLFLLVAGITGFVILKSIGVF